VKRTVLIGICVLLGLAAWTILPALRPSSLLPPPSPPFEPPTAKATPLPDASPPDDLAISGPPADAGFVTGCVLLDSSLSPVFGVPVLARPAWPTTGSPARGVSDLAGEYRLALPPGTWSLAAWGKGMVPSELAAPTVRPDCLVVRIESGETVHRDLLVTQSGQLRGRVLRSTGQPVPRARVELRFSSLLRKSGLRLGPVVASTDTAGGFHLAPVPPGVHLRVVAFAPNGLGAVSAPVLIPAGGAGEVEIRFPGPRFVQVMVVEKETGSPLPGATLQVLWMPEPRIHLTSPRVFRTDAEGEVRIGPLPPCGVWFRVEAEGRSSYLDSTPAANPDDTEIRIEMPPADRLAGRVVFPDGEPLTHGRLEIHCVNEAGGSTGWSDLEPQLDQEGRFLVAGVPRGIVRIERDTVRDGKRYRLEFETRSGKEDLLLTLQPFRTDIRRWVEILVLDPDGKPVPCGRWQSGWRSSSGGDWYCDGLVQDAGYDNETRMVKLELFDARDEDGAPLPLGAVFAGPLPIDHGPVVVRLPSEKSVTGRVVGPGGQPVAGARLLFRPAPRETGRETSAHGCIHEAVVSGADGRFRAGRLGDGGYTIEVNPPPAFGRIAPVQVQAGDRDTFIELPDAGRIRVTLLDWKDEPISVATVEARLPEDRRGGIPLATGRTGVDGIVTLTGLGTKGPLIVVGHAPPDRTDLVPMVRAQWREGDLTLRFARMRSLRLQIVDCEGRSVPEARVWYRASESPGWQTARADSEGRVLLRTSGAGWFSLRISARHGDPGDPWTAEHDAEATDDVQTIRIERGGRLRLKLTDWPRGRSGNVRIETEGRHRFFRFLVDANGRVDLDGLRFPCTILVRPCGTVGQTESLCAILRPKEPSGSEILPIPLTHVLSITGHLIPAPAQGAATISAHVVGEIHFGIIDQDGGYRIHGLPEGNWLVKVRAGSFQRETRVDAGSTADFDLR